MFRAFRNGIAIPRTDVRERRYHEGMERETLRFPIGPFVPNDPSPSEREELIRHVERTPRLLREAVAGLDETELDTPYRDGGWTIRQVVHHLPDSHLNSYVRFRLALTETSPVIRPYDEGAWAELLDARSAPPEISLSLLDSLHMRWVLLLRSLSSREWARTLIHPSSGEMTLGVMLAMYAWHGQHHVAHITSWRARSGR